MERKTSVQIDPSGIISEVANPQDALRKAAEANVGWDYSSEARKLYNRADTVLDRLYPAINTPNFEGRLPKVAIGIESLRNKNTLAAYHLVPDSVGLPFKITFNEQHYIDSDGGGQKEWRFGEWSQMETLVHELGHHWQQMLGRDPFTKKSRVTHNVEFRDKMKQLGIYCDSGGAHYQVADTDSPSGILFREWGLKPPADVPRGEPNEFDWFKWFADQEGKSRPGRSTLHKWVCPECNLKVRYGRKDDPQLIHEPCGALLVRGS
jgi:hypothetical protein